MSTADSAASEEWHPFGKESVKEKRIAETKAKLDAIGGDLSRSNDMGDAVPLPENAAQPANENKELQREIDALAAMPLLKYEREYKEAAKRLGMRAAVLDSVVKAARSSVNEDAATMFKTVDPWPSPP